VIRHEIVQLADHLPPVAVIGFDCTFPGCDATYRHPYGQSHTDGWLEAGATLAGWTGAPTDRTAHYRPGLGLTDALNDTAPRCPQHPYGTPVAAITAPRETRKGAE
jgi:hypothetical protein